MTPLHIKTPLLESRALTLPGGGSVWLKVEAMQPPGSFKVRGVGLACQEYARRGANRFVSSSGGNAGIAAAFAGRQLGLPVVVVVPETTTERAKALITRERAELIVHGASWQEANESAVAMLGPSDAFLHPFDDPLLWQGHSTLIDEVAESGVRPDAIVLSVGGGHGWTDVPVIAAETTGAASLARSMEAGKSVELDAITSIATSLGARRVCDKALEWTARHPVRSAVVSDRAAIDACHRFLDDHRLVVEPACGAALAVVYEELPEVEGFDSVLVIVCGGVTASVEQLNAWRAV
jgi:L-serine/L-threonine ammonia-lyase